MVYFVLVFKFKVVVFLGVGFLMLVVFFLCCVYYNVIIVWCLYYMFKLFVSIVLWVNCDNWWNMFSCVFFKKLINGVINNGGLVNNIGFMNLILCINDIVLIVGNLMGNVFMLFVKCFIIIINVIINGIVMLSNVMFLVIVGGNFFSKEFWENYVF